MPHANLLILLAVFLPPVALDILGKVVEEHTVQTPYGRVGPLALRAPRTGPPVWIQPYTGAPARTDPRATILAARRLGVQQVLTWDHVVALNPTLERGQLALVTDYIDWTHHQPASFGEAVISQEDLSLSPTRPSFCPHMASALRQTFPLSMDVVYVGVDGPRRETSAEARMFTSWGADVVGQNMVPEAALAKELALCYAGLVTISDYGADRAVPVRSGAVRSALETTLEALPAFVELAGQPGDCECAHTGR
jgi:5'-methylthioadenosine phosphorylase